MRTLKSSEVSQVSGGLCLNGMLTQFFPGATREFIDMIQHECRAEGVQTTTSSTISGVWVNKVVGGAPGGGFTHIR